MIGRCVANRPYMYLPLKGDTNDYSVNAQNPSNTGATSTTGQFGESNGAYRFEEIGDYLSYVSSIGNTIATYLNSNSTILAFIITDSVITNRIIARQYESSGNRSWFINNGGLLDNINFGKDTGSSTTYISSTNTTTDNVWQMIATTTSGTNGQNVVFYIEGSSETATLNIIAKTNSTTSVRIGGRADASNSGLQGSMHTFRIYSNTLSVGELKIINNEKGRIRA